MDNRLYWSRYNFLETIDGNHYLYNSYSNSILQVDDELFNTLSKIKNREWSIGHNTPNNITSDIIEELKNRYILVNNDDLLVDVMQHQSLTRLYSKSHMTLTIAPTQSCNFSCVYCFEKWRKSKPLSSSTADSIVEYLAMLHKNEGLKTMDLIWYGGEPLLQMEVIKTLGKRITELGLIITTHLLITNGYNFTLQNIDDLQKLGITDVQITIDGCKTQHDKSRPLLNGKGTFDKIINNLDEYFNSQYRDCFDISIRVNIDKDNYMDFIALHHWLTSRYSSNRLYVYPGIIVLDEQNENRHKCLNRNEVTNFYLSLYNDHGIICEELFPENINMECMARSPYMNLLIGPNGDIYKCYEDLGNSNLIVGNINNKSIISEDPLVAQYAAGINHYNDPICRKCSYLPICNGGCPIRRFENKYKGAHNDCCTPFKGRIRDYIKLFLQTIQKQNVSY